MLTSSRRDEPGLSPSRSATAAAAFFAVGLLAVALLLGRAPSSGAEAVEPGSGTVAIDGRIYPFAPETCVITDDGFVASGPGSWGEETYVASVSKKGGVQVAFGVRSDVDRPDPGQLWWVAPKVGRSRINGTSVHATATVEDRSGTVSGARSAVVHLTCPERS